MMNIPFSPPDISEEEVKEVTEALKVLYQHLEDQKK